MVDAEEARALALALPGASEQDHHGRPSFRVEGKIYATLWTATALNVMLVDDLILAAVATSPDVCSPRYWGKRLAAVRVDLDVADASLVGDLLQAAWSQRVPGRS
ncbi:MAG: hypothetical protein QOI43_791 [Gaiellales bacterium]|nr:hypothetical protein [Gaiellales bacterium]